MAAGLGVGDSVGDINGVGVALIIGLGLREGLAEGLGETVGLTVMLGEGVMVGDTVGEGVIVCDKAVKTNMANIPIIVPAAADIVLLLFMD